MNASKKDLYWVIAFAVLALIAIITFWLGGKGNEIVSYISFASALVSIILALVAIFYSFVQNVNSQQNIGEMKILVSEASRLMTEKAGTLAEQAMSMEESLQQLLKTSGEFSGPATPLTDETFLFDSSHTAVTTLLIFYYLTRCHELKKLLKLNILWHFVTNPGVVEPIGKQEKICLALYAGGLLHGLQCFLEPESIVIHGDFSKYEIRKLPSGFKENILKTIKTRIEAAEVKDEHRIWLSEDMKKIDAHVEAE
jgi:hypothetical protein